MPPSSARATSIAGLRISLRSRRTLHVLAAIAGWCRAAPVSFSKQAGRLGMRIIDADGHVAEGPSLAVEAMRRWPDRVVPREDGGALVIEGRNYPEADGPGAGCPREHGLSGAEGIAYSSAQGVLGDADRDHIDTMVLYPSLGLCVPSLEDPELAAGFARLYNQWIAA